MSWRDINTWQRNKEINALDGLKWAQGFLKQTPWRSLKIPSQLTEGASTRRICIFQLDLEAAQEQRAFKEAKERFEGLVPFDQTKLLTSVWITPQAWMYSRPFKVCLVHKWIWSWTILQCATESSPILPVIPCNRFVLDCTFFSPRLPFASLALCSRERSP